jgi:hypothetical protein
VGLGGVAAEMIPRLYIYGLVGLAFVGLVFALKVQTGRVGALKDENGRLAATIAAERENVRKANEASEKYAVSLENLKAARAATPVRSVRLCVNTGVPETRATTGTAPTSAEGLQEALGSNIKASRDIGRELYELADEADLCPAKLEALQDWVRNR